jgi:hypothetical protein
MPRKLRSTLLLALALLSVRASLNGQEEQLSVAAGKELAAKAEALYNDGHYREASEAIRISIAYWVKLKGPDHRDVAYERHIAGLIAYELQDYAGARPEFEAALRTFERVGEFKSAHTASVALSLAYELLGLRDMATSEFAHSLKLLESAGQATAEELANAIETRAGGLMRAHHYTDAEAAYRDAAARLGPNDSQLKAANQAGLGDALYGQSKYPAARVAYRLALAMFDRLKIKNQRYFTAALSLALISVKQGQTADGVRELKAVLVETEQIWPKGHPAIARLLFELGDALVQLRRYAEAKELLLRCLTIRKDIFGPQHPDTLAVEADLGYVLQFDRDFKQARGLIESALKELPEGHPYRPAMLADLGVVLQESGEYDLAFKTFTEALHLSDGEDQTYYLDLAVSAWRLGRTQEAQDFLLQAGQRLNGSITRLLPSLSLAEQQSLLNVDVPFYTDLLFSICTEDRCLAGPYGQIVRWKGLLLEGVRREAVALNNGRVAGNTDVYRELQSVKAGLTALVQDRRITMTAVNNGSWDSLVKRKQDLERQLGLAEISNAERGPEILGSLQHHLQPDELFVDIYRIKKYSYRALEQHDDAVEYYMGVVADGAAIHFVDIGEAKAIDDALTNWVEEVTASGPGDVPLRYLRKALWERLPITVAKTKIWVCPDSKLHGFPWLLMLAGEPNPPKVQVSQVDSPTEFLALQSRAVADALARGKMLLVGAVDYGRPRAGIQAFGELTKTDTELKLIRKELQGSPVRIVSLRGQTATKTRVLSELEGATWLHLATHGFFLNDAKQDIGPVRQESVQFEQGEELTGFLRSGLALTGANITAGRTLGSEGILMSDELIGTDLSKAELVTLSACETGGGEIVRGQGVLGMRSAVMAAGTRRLLTSLWKIPDDATAILMVAFYSNMFKKHHSVMLSLIEAQDYLKHYGNGQFAAPVNWAGWMLIGVGW